MLVPFLNLETIGHSRGFSAAFSAAIVPRMGNEIEPFGENAAALIEIADQRFSMFASR